MPGAGAEILVDRVRRLISKGKCGADEWLDIMHEAHKLNITTSATMMFGHVETIEERFIHLARIREVQDQGNQKMQKAFLLLFHGHSRMLILCLHAYAACIILQRQKNI